MELINKDCVMKAGDKNHSDEVRQLVGELKSLEQNPETTEAFCEAMQELSAKFMANLHFSLN